MNHVLESHGIKLETLESFGKRVGAAIARTGREEILYNLRNAKNSTDFLRVMSEISFRLNVIIPIEILQIAFPFDVNGKNKRFYNSSIIEFLRNLLVVIIKNTIIAIDHKNQKKNENQ